jgi:hypothetical protein
MDAVITEAEGNSLIPYNYFFRGRDSIHQLEFFDYLNLNTLAMALDKDIEKLEAWKAILFDYRPEGMDIALFYSLIIMFQIGLVADRLGIE